MQPFTLAPASQTAAVGVLAQSASSCAAQLLTIRAWASRHGLEVIDLGTSAEPNGVDAGCQLVIALGGDGTILRALQVAMTQHAPVLGVNF
ncbi:MAG: NAD(+)/NADH kinase, partial [Solirubrobacteraceae bacterium]